ncbi:hypothetical protein ED733_001768 [Metarhizium rileyi]|uniref:Uncharacterized protein n=1 Tax=Metarhizium rileyi (strain RCEF 4871) TaxID=1649241 RepID=A0A5C6G6X1_METRR|nr:hypothetical protein ED733_001768 [Metarhizium rileyi]
MVPQPLERRAFDGSRFSSGFFFIIVPVVILLVAGVASAIMRLTRRLKRRAAKGDGNVNPSGPYATNISNARLISQLHNLPPQPYTLSSLPAEQMTDHPCSGLTSLRNARLPGPYERRDYSPGRSPSAISSPRENTGVERQH